jgi:hypothetical protein
MGFCGVATAGKSLSIEDLPIQESIFEGFPIVMFDFRRVLNTWAV